MDEPSPPAAVEVVYALPAQQWLVSVPFVEGLTALQAVHQSGVLECFPEITTRPLVLGIFGVEVGESQSLRPGDRVEVCRPLPEDPRAMRRRAVARGGTMGEAD